jgi:DNA repair exonuclease SbcCD ATPase subunit
MRKMMAKASSDLANNLKQTDPGGKYGGKIANKQANKEEIAEKKNKISDLKEQISNWNKEKSAALLLGVVAYAAAKKTLDPKIQKNEQEIKVLEAQIKQLESGQSISTTNQAAQSSVASTGATSPVSYAGSNGTYTSGPGNLTPATRTSPTLR